MNVIKFILLLVLGCYMLPQATAQKPEGKSCPDSIVYEGETYKTVWITNQCWLNRNLNTGKFIKGTENQTNNNITEKYCYNDLPANCNTYGGLYQWDEMMVYGNKAGSKGICPTGWHIPTVQEWALLENNLGNYVGTKLKQGEASGFEGLLAGERCLDGSFKFLEYYAYFWTSSEISKKISWYRILLHNSFDCDAGSGNHEKTEGFSVRCLKDN